MTPRLTPLRTGLLALCLTTAGCVANGPFPSLQPRAAEQTSNMEEPVRQPVLIASEQPLRARTAGLLATARRGQQAFEAAFGTASTSAARAGAAGSESWIEAQQAISRVEAARAETVQALADLDALSIERAEIATSIDDLGIVASALEEAQNIANAQSERLDRLRASVRTN